MVVPRFFSHLAAQIIKALPKGFAHTKFFAKKNSRALPKALPPHLLLGAAGENRAAHYLGKKGYLILAQNWRYKQVELDLICKDKGTVVFVEVKTRSVASSFSSALNSARNSALNSARNSTQNPALNSANSALNSANSAEAPAPLASPESAFSPAKQAHLITAAAAWLSAHDAWNLPCRFDLVCIVKNGDQFNLEHYCHVIELSNLVAGGHTAWQPW